MKKIYNSFFLALSFLFYYNSYAQCTLACYADINLALNVTGNASITASDVLDSFGPSCGALVVEPSSFDCSDIGASVLYTVTDPLSGNSCFGFIHVEFNAMAMSCFANVNVALGPSGTETLTADMLLFDPPAECMPRLVISPSVVTCADVGSPVFVTVTDPVSGNSCWSTVNVSYNVGAMSCFADIYVQLDASGNFNISPDILIADPDADCIPGAIVSPSSLDCSDIGTAVFTTITDPVSGNSCWLNITVEDPRPESCDIIVPSPIYCGDSGVIFTSNVTGGYGPFDYEWKIKGNPNGWSILSGQGTNTIAMQVGIKKIKLELTITDVCGKKRKCSVKPSCEEPPSTISEELSSEIILRTQAEEITNLELYPNPAKNQLFINSNIKDLNQSQIRIVNELGQHQNVNLLSSTEEDELNLSLEHLSPGIYWLLIEDEKQGLIAKKFLKL